jgi:hypothetical protein
MSDDCKYESYFRCWRTRPAHPRSVHRFMLHGSIVRLGGYSSPSPICD